MLGEVDLVGDSGNYQDGSYQIYHHQNKNSSIQGETWTRSHLPSSDASAIEEMMQSKIQSFFKPSSIPRAQEEPPSAYIQTNAGDIPVLKSSEITVTYRRRDPNPNCSSVDEKVQIDARNVGRTDGKPESSSIDKILNKKRSYAQYYLDLGQSDFSLHSCSVCGMMYARGDDEDEQVHTAFHKNYYQGIQYKGWRNERDVSISCSDKEKILLVLDGDPPAQKHKVQEILKVIERELCFSNGELPHKLSKVYLFVSSHRIVGCLISEPIRTAHKVILSSLSCNDTDYNCTTRSQLVSSESEVTEGQIKRSNSTYFHFGNIKFHREVDKKVRPLNNLKVLSDGGAVLCEEEAVPAVCGIMVIWVAPSHRRKLVATRLLDAARQSFCEDCVLESSQCAFSSPTSAGKALICSYSRSTQFLVYKSDNT